MCDAVTLSKITQLEKELKLLHDKCSSLSSLPQSSLKMKKEKKKRIVAGPITIAKLKPTETYLSKFPKLKGLGEFKKIIPAPFNMPMMAKFDKIDLANKANREILLNCPLMKTLLNESCNFDLDEEKYQYLSQTYSLFPKKASNHTTTISWSILTSVMSSLVQESPSACIGGYLELWLTSLRQQEQRGKRGGIEQEVVIPELTHFSLIKNFEEKCLRKDIVYIPLTAQWIDPRNVEKVMKNFEKNYVYTHSPALLCRDCHKIDETEEECENMCISAHEMDLMLFPQTKEIEYFEPNGRIAPHFQVISEYLNKNMNQLFPGYKLINPESCPSVGLQAGGYPMCSFYSTLYAALRLQCPSLTAQSITNALLPLGREGIKELLRRWMCFVYDYANKTGILSASENYETLYKQVKTKLINPHIYIIPSNSEERMEEIIDIASFHILQAYILLDKLNKEIKQIPGIRIRRRS